MAARKYPPIPRRISAPGGPVRVIINRNLHYEGDKCWGVYEQEHRKIRLERVASREHQWRTLCHELAHVWLIDAGCDAQLSVPGTEALCDAISTGMMRFVYDDPPPK